MQAFCCLITGLFKPCKDKKITSIEIVFIKKDFEQKVKSSITGNNLNILLHSAVGVENQDKTIHALFQLIKEKQSLHEFMLFKVI